MLLTGGGEKALSLWATRSIALPVSGAVGGAFRAEGEEAPSGLVACDYKPIPRKSSSNYRQTHEIILTVMRFGKIV